MRRWLYIGAATIALLATATALAKPPKGAVRGRFNKSTCLACDGSLVRLLSTSNVWCAWNKNNHVIVHVSFRNHAVEHVTLSVDPAYTIKNGGTHGDGITNLQSIGINGNAFRAVFIDAGKPDGVPAKSPIGVCKPHLFDEKSG